MKKSSIFSLSLVVLVFVETILGLVIYTKSTIANGYTDVHPNYVPLCIMLIGLSLVCLVAYGISAITVDAPTTDDGHDYTMAADDYYHEYLNELEYE